MNAPTKSHRANPLLSAAAYLTTLAVFLVAVFFVLRNNDEIQLAVVVAIFVTFTILESVLMLASPRLFVRRILFGVQAVLAGMLFFSLPSSSGVAAIMLVLLAAQAFFSFDSPEQLIWGGVFLVEIFVLMFLTVDPLDALLTGLIYAGIFAFMLAIARALQREQTVRAESERLAAELENANAQLRAYTIHAQDLAVAQERTRMAREIHDSLGHHLTVLSVQLQAASKLIEREPVRAAEQIEKSRRIVAQALQDVRHSVNALRDGSPLDAYDMQALPRLVHDFGNATGIQTTYAAPEQMPARAPAQMLTLYRAVQEGLTNAQKHTNATRIDVHIVCADQNLDVRIQDNGSNAPNADAAPGFGLVGLSERVALLGGTMRAGPRTEGGFELRVELPIEIGESK